MKAEWEEQRRRWLSFEAWERRHLRSTSADYARALAWMADAWELAARFSPSWGSPETAGGHWRHLADIQRRLGRAFPRP
jgi:hypothetical protein